ncbi:uncharacterized protein RJT21DRAFT_122728 [Scheffersomyces amazonensis]|uniref:uncharacterized protein n=1 Tax=Scheffersomyces amazonensis TaxID=1078765 RepID=UPI00315DAB34
MVQQVSKKGRVYFKVLNMEDFNNSFYRKKWIQVISGSTFGSKNSIVVKIENEFGNESTLNIFDPIRTVPFTISNGNAHKSLALCLKNFVKEVFSLHQLRQFGFVPQISEFGVIINETARYVSEVTPNRMEDSGFFYNYPAKGKRLCEFSYKEVRYLEPTIRRAVSQMHQAGVAHLNLNSSNIIVQDLDSKKVCIIDFSHSYMEWHKNYQWPAYSYGTKIKTELPRNFSMAARLDLDSLDLISCCII